MEIKNARLVKVIDNLRFIDIDITENGKTIPYTFYEGEINTQIDRIIKRELDAGRLEISESSKSSEKAKKVKRKEFDLWEYRNSLYKKFKNEYHLFLNEGYIIYKEHLFNLSDYDKFNSFYILNKKVNFIDVQNRSIELEQNDFRNILELIFEKRESLLRSYQKLKQKLEEARTKSEADCVNWDFEV